MRGKPAVLVSLVAHGAVLVIVARWAVVQFKRPASAALAPPPAARAPDPVDVSLLDDASAPTARGGATRRGGRPAPGPRGDAQIAASRGGAGETAEPARPEPGTGGTLLKMRGPELGVGDDFLAGLDRKSRPIETVHRNGRLDNAGRGAHVIRDLVTTVTVDRDGTAHFHDKDDFEVHWDIHLPTFEELARQGREAGRQIAEWYKDPYAQTRVGRSQDVPRYLSAVPGACDSWTDMCSSELRDRDRPLDKDRGGVVHGKLDATAMLMRHTVGDPYASRKRALLDGTRDERADIGARNAKEDLARSAEIMQGNLERLWRTTRDWPARREALFTLWDECGEGDGPVGEAGERARRLVIGWIRAKLPPGTPGAFTPDDIARLGAQRASRQPFVPY